MIPISGVSVLEARAFAKLTPIINDPANPGPFVTLIASRSSILVLASERALSTVGPILMTCCLDANSGTMPPCGACISTCDAIILDTIVFPLSTTETAVSSHDDSMPNILLIKVLSHPDVDQDGTCYYGLLNDIKLVDTIITSSSPVRR